MDYYAVQGLRENHPGWALLRADHAPLLVAFFVAAFIEPNRRNIPRRELIDSLEDVLFMVRDAGGNDAFPRSAAEYLDNWAAPEKAWLRKFYLEGQDDPIFDLTPTTEDAVRWVQSLQGREFVATQSRLTGIFALLKTLVQGSETDPEVRLAQLEAERAGIDARIEAVGAGDLPVMTGPEALDHYQQLRAQAQDLLSDFREDEQNFRDLDRKVRERIATWEGTQGELLDAIFTNQEDISGSLQGRTFQGFWDYLMSPAQRAELSDLLDKATKIPTLARVEGLGEIVNLQRDWLPAVEQTQGTVRRLSQQMRRLLDDKVFLENKRIMQLIRSIESNALALRNDPPAGSVAELPAQQAEITLPFERPLYKPGTQVVIDDEVALAEDTEVDSKALFDQFYVDRAELQSNIDEVLGQLPQASLGQVLAVHPLEKGLAEVVTYFQIAAETTWATIDGTRTQTLSWATSTGARREATVEHVTFVRPE